MSSTVRWTEALGTSDCCRLKLRPQPCEPLLRPVQYFSTQKPKVLIKEVVG